MTIPKVQITKQNTEITPMAAANGMDIQWKYEVPRWLFPPPMS